jgi:monofunctional biosynthetic peptidoglycan transglycosylase
MVLPSYLLVNQSSITLTQLENVVLGYGLKRDYVSYDQISPNMKLAVLASEDQLFTDHDGF